MKKKEIQFFRNLLQRELYTLTAKSDNAVGNWIQAGVIQEPDLMDQVMEEQARDRRLHFRNRDQKLIDKIQQRLQAIEDGSYGICEDCAEPIAIARLKARPVTSYCIDCKTRQEMVEQMTGS